jgi:RNA polymerase sigma-70 factor, ECF subfamily
VSSPAAKGASLQPFSVASRYRELVDGVVTTDRTEGEPLERDLVAELPELRAFLRRVAAGAARSEVEDMVQEVMARALRYRESFDGSRELGPWLRGTALRVLLDHRAKLARAPTALGEHEEASAEASADEVGERMERLDSIERALERLSEVEREIVVRFHGRDESIREIAAALALPEGTVKSHLHRARRKLAEERP